MKDKSVIMNQEFIDETILTPELLDDIYNDLDYELAEDLIFQARIKSIEDTEDSAYKRVTDW